MAVTDSTVASPRTVPAPSRRLIAAGIKRGSGRLVIEQPAMSATDRAAHAAASYVRTRPVALTDDERKELSDKVREVNKRSSGR